MTTLNEFTKAVEHMKATKFDGTYFWHLNTDDSGNDWAIVLGWSDGYEPDENDDCMDGTYRLCAKIAYQPSNSAMQCDYDLDWTMPYDEETGETDYTEIAIYSDDSIDRIYSWLLTCYLTYDM